MCFRTWTLDSVRVLVQYGCTYAFVYSEGALTHSPSRTADEQGDFMIRAGEGLPAVTVHKSILAARSGFFRALLEGGMGDATQGGLTLKVASCTSTLL